MRKKDLVVQIATKIGERQVVVKRVVDEVLESISSALEAGDRVELRKFGIFNLRSRKERIGRNPKTGETIKVPPRKVPYFKPGKVLAQRVNKWNQP